MTELLAVAAAALMGFALQRGTVCAVLAARDLVDHGRWHRLLALFLAGAVVALVAGASLLIVSAPRIVAWTVGWGTVVGGILFGVGATLNDGCAMGTIAKLARGQLGFAAAIPGFVLGAWVGVEVGGLPPGQAATLGLGPAVAFAALVVALWPLLRRRQSPSGTRWIAWRGPWSVEAAMITLGLAAGVLIGVGQSWSYLAILSDLAIERRSPGAGEAALIAALFLGGFTAAFAAGELRWNVPTPPRLVLHLAGGTLMGFGAALLPGGNDVLVLAGLPFLLAHAWLGVAVMLLTIVTLLHIKKRSC